MKIPEEIITVFEEETDGIDYGSVSIGITIRGGHKHFEINKHITFSEIEDQQADSDSPKYEKKE